MAKEVGRLKATLGLDKTKYERGMNDAEKRGSKFGQAIKRIGGILAAAFAVHKIVQWGKAVFEAYRVQKEAEVKLETVLKQRMGLGKEAVESLKKQASEYQKIGTIGDEVQLSGLQQLATFLKQKESLESLLPAMNNLLAQQKGINATAGDAVGIANLMGKVLDGQVSALRRVGISFTGVQEKALKTGNEIERAAILAEVITANVGNMNVELGKTDLGKIQKFKNTFSDLKETIGEKLVPVLAKAAVLMTRLITPRESKALEIEKRQLNSLVGIITNEITQKKDRIELLKKLQKEYPDFLKNLDAEKITNQELRDRLIEVNKAYDDRIKAAVRQELIAKKSNKLARLVEAEYAAIKRLEWLQSDAARNMGARRDVEIKATEDVIRKRQEQRKKIEEVIEAQVALLNSDKEIIKANDGTAAGVGELTGVIEEEIETIATLTQKIAGENEKLEDTNVLSREAIILSQKKIAAWEAEIEAIRKLAVERAKAEAGPVPEKVAAKEADLIPTPGAPKGTELVAMGYVTIFDAAQKAKAAIAELNAEMFAAHEATAMFFGGLADTIGEALYQTMADSKQFFKTFGKIFTDFITRMIAQLTAAAIVALALAALMTIITGGGMLKGAVSFGNYFKMGFKMFGGFEFQHGGIVPPGYPNDTFPAMLTSGERVLTSSESGDFREGKIYFEFGEARIKNDYIYLAVKEVERKRKNSF